MVRNRIFMVGILSFNSVGKKVDSRQSAVSSQQSAIAPTSHLITDHRSLITFTISYLILVLTPCFVEVSLLVLLPFQQS